MLEFEINLRTKAFENLLKNYSKHSSELLPAKFSSYQLIDFENLSLESNISSYCVYGTVINIQPLDSTDYSCCISLKPPPCNNSASANLFYFTIKGKNFDFLKNVTPNAALFFYDFKLEALSDPPLFPFQDSDIPFVFTYQTAPKPTRVGLVYPTPDLIKLDTVVSKQEPPNTITKLNKLVAGKCIDICGIVVMMRSPSKTARGEYCMTVVVTDDSFEDGSSGVTCVLFSKIYDALPIMAKIACIIKLKGLKTQMYQNKIQCMGNIGYSWTVFVQNAIGSYDIADSSDKNSSDVDIDQPYLDHLSTWYTNSLQHSDPVLTFGEINTPLDNFSMAVLVLGFFTFKQRKKSILVVTDGTKCPMITLPSNFSFSEASVSYISWQSMELYKNTCNYVIVDEEKFIMTANIFPFSFVQLSNLSASTSSCFSKTHLQLELLPQAQSAQSILLLSTTSDLVLDIKARLSVSEEPIQSSQWTSVTLPGLSVVNTQAMDLHISEDLNLPQSSQNFHFKLSDKFLNVPLTPLKSLFENPFLDDLSIHRVSARIIGIWPESFSLGVTAYCDTCCITFQPDHLQRSSNGELACKGCFKILSPKLRFILLLNNDDFYLSTILTQERALEFFNIKYKLNELMPSVCQKIDTKYESFFNHFSASLRISDENDSCHNICILSRKITNLGINSDQEVNLYEIIGVNIV